MKLTIPKLSFVVLIGVSGSGKSTFARKHFKPTEILSSDYCRGLVSDDENSQAATNVQIESRKPLVEIAREFHCLPVAIVLDLPERVAHDRNKARPDRDFGPHVIRQQAQQLHRSLRGLEREGFRHVHVLKSLEDIEAAVIERQPLWNNLKQEHGPFDIIGDVHGCFDELVELLGKLGYETGKSAGAWHHPEGRKMVFVGDLVDRGPKIPEVVRLVMDSVNFGSAFCVPGNHDMKFMRKIWGKDVQITHGLAESLAQFEAYEQHYRGFSRVAADSIHKLVSHYLLDDGKLVVAHAGMKESMQGRGSGAVREFALFGETTGETDEFSLPARYNWAAEYRGTAAVVYGHTPVPEPEWLNRTINIDTGCVFGGKLTALRYPEKELVSVPAKQTYGEPRKPFLPNDQLAGGPPALLSAQQQNDDLLDLADMMGKRIVSTRLHGNVTIREENSIAALEVMSRFAANPKWLIYLPPTMSPSETSQAPGLLEHPAEAFAYFRHTGVPRVVCEEKHMGSRAVVIVCRNEDAARKNFGVTGEGIGICYTRTGRRFFDNVTLEAEFLERVRAAATAAGFWDEFKTDWLCLDCKRMPWSAKAQELVKQQYAAVGASAQATLAAEVAVLKQTAERGLDVSELLAHTTARSQMVSDYIEAYRRYCWPVNSVNDLKLAPFHLLASEGAVHTDKPNDWHMQTLACLAGGIIDPRLHRIVAAQPYPLLFATVSGAHLYGFPSPDSDFDLRGAHVLPLDAVVGLEIRDETIQQEMIVPPDESEGRARHSVRAENGKQSDGAQGTDAPYQNNSLEMDIVSHDVRKFFGLLLKKNGYVLEQLFSPLIVSTTPEHAKLKEICRAQLNPRRSRGNEAHSSSGESQNLLTSAATGVITKHHSLHYFGFAETQWKLFLKESPRRVKPLLYVYRVLLTGIHLMRTGEVQANLFTLNKEFRLPHVADLVARKLAGPEKSKLDDADIVFHESEYQRLRGELQAAHDASQLPDRPSDETRAALNDLLVRVRLQSTRNPAP